MTISIDAYGRDFAGHVDSIQAGSGTASVCCRRRTPPAIIVPGRAARSREADLRQAARCRDQAGHVGGALGQGAMSAAPARQRLDPCTLGSREPQSLAHRRPSCRSPPSCEVLDTSIASVALRHIAGSLAASIEESTWVITGYLVSNAVILPISGWLAEVIGRKRFCMGSVALFTLSSFLCGLAPNLALLIAARIFQGLGGGGLAPSEQSMLADTFPPSKRAQAFSLYGVTVIVAPALGPTIGGYITDNVSWNWIFFINVPMGLISLVLVALFVNEPEVLRRERRGLLAGGLKVDWFRLHAGGAGARLPRDRAGQGPGGRLVRLRLHHRLRRDLGPGDCCCSCRGELEPPPSDRQYKAARLPAVRHLLGGDAGGRRHSLQLHPVHAAAAAGEFRLHRDAGRADADARRLHRPRPH